MQKKDDCTLSPDDYLKVRAEAHRILLRSDAIGRFPTPVRDILSVAKVDVVDDDILNEGFLSKLKRKAGKALKAAIAKTIGLLDVKERLVFIDKTVHAVRQTFLKIHEAGHYFMVWQRRLYAVVEDCEKTISPEIEDYFEREANVFTSEVLFQLDEFTEEAEDYEFGIKVPIDLSRKYGASVYASIRRYVSKSRRACTVLVTDPPVLTEGDGFRANLRRVISSQRFREVVGHVNWPKLFTPDDQIGALIPIHGRKMSAPHEVFITNQDGDERECVAEAFRHKYHAFILIHAVGTLARSTVSLAP